MKRAVKASPNAEMMVWAAIVVISVAAWMVTVRQTQMDAAMASDMPIGLFLSMWMPMMVAMMLPSVAPVALVWSRSIVVSSVGRERARRLLLFVVGYLAVWAGIGLVAHAGLTWASSLAISTGRADVVAAVIYVAAGLYQLSPLKNVCLTHCRSPMAHLLTYGNYKGPLRDLRVGVSHGSYCAGCCWGLMLILIALGVMNLAAMATIAVVVALEKLWKHGPTAARLAGVGLIVLGVLSLVVPALSWGIAPGGAM